MKSLPIMMHLLLALLLSVSLLHAQAEQPCSPAANPQLKDLLSKGKYPRHLATNRPCQWASSFLKASGKQPEQMGQTYIDWSCSYAPSAAWNSDEKEAWIGKPGELLLFHSLDWNSPLELYAGFGKSASLFSAYARPKELHILLIEAKKREEQEAYILFEELEVVDSHILELEDERGYQRLELPEIEYQLDAGHYLIGIEVLDVYPGKKYKQVAVSGLRQKQLAD